jgi:hypothetical protein
VKSAEATPTHHYLTTINEALSGHPRKPKGECGFMRNGKLRVTLFVSLLFSLSGCGLTGTQQQATARFARASAGLGEFTAKEFSGLREVTIAMNTRNIVINGEAELKNLDESLDPDVVSVRISAATALSSYGRLLLSLVEETQGEEIKAASDDFVDSFKRVSGKTLSDQQLEALGTVVQGIGRLFVEQRKATAVKRIVKEAQPDVDHICDLLIADFNRTGLRVGQGVDVTITRLKADAKIALSTPGVDHQRRMVAVEAFKLADDVNNRLSVLGTQAVKTLTTLKSANQQLVSAMENDESSIADIQTLGKQIKELADAARALSGK